MVFLNYTTMQVTAKIVYYGPGLCGKTTNLQWIHGRTAPASRGEMISLETQTDRTLFFDLLPLDVGMIGGMKVRLQLYTVPGQVFYNATRRLVLKGADGIVFVADSQQAALEPNEESISNLYRNLEELGVEPHEVPIVFQYNKRDLSNILSVAELDEALNPTGVPCFEAAAVHGVGVFETLKEISRRTLDAVRERVSGGGEHAGVRRKKATKARAEEAAAPPGETPGAADPSLLEPLQIEFAEEDTDKMTIRPVRTQGSDDIGRQLDKLRMEGSGSNLKPVTALRDGDVDRLFSNLMASEGDSEQELEHRQAIEVPEALLRGLSELKIHLGFEQDGREELLRDGVRLRLAKSDRLERLRLHLDLELKRKS